MSNKSFTIISTAWRAHAEQLGKVRRQVFVQEQNVPEELEWDDLDEQCTHVLALDSQNLAIGTGRLCPHGHIGRMAVLESWRGNGVGSALLQALMEIGKQTDNRILVLNSQTSATGFYLKHGFKVEGDEFLDANIPHLKMTIII